MASRHEEKYIIDYRQYVLLKNRAMQLLTPDSHGVMGSYLITSLYFDDFFDSALDEKLDGLAEHTKFRIRSYDCDGSLLKLERKDKHGLLTKKFAASISREQLPFLNGVHTELEHFDGKAWELAAQIQARDLRPVIAVRYRRDAFFYEGTDFRLTFDTQLEAIGPEAEALFSTAVSGLAVLDSNSVIMEIKYGSHIPAFARKFTAVSTKQLSVSKYALCREKHTF